MARKGRYQRIGDRLAQDRLGDYRVTGDVYDAIFGNLRTTAKGVGSTQNAINANQVKLLKRMAATSKRQNRQLVRGTQNAITNQYGTGFGGVASQDLQGARAVGQAGTSEARAAAGTGGAMAATGRDVAAIQNRGIAATQVAADYMLNKALATRASDDVKFVEGMKHDEMMARLNAKLQYDTWEKQQKFLLAQEEDPKNIDKSYRGMTTVAERMATASSIFRAMFSGDPEMTQQEAITAYQDQYGVVSPEELIVLNALASDIKQKGIYAGSGNEQPGIQREVDAIVNSMMNMYPNFRGRRDDIEKYVRATLNKIYSGDNPQAGGPGLLSQIWQAFPDFGLEVVSGGNAFTQTYNPETGPTSSHA